MNSKLILLVSTVTLLSACGVNVGTSETKEWVYPVNNPYDNDNIPVNNPYDNDNIGYYDASSNITEVQALPKFVKTAETPQIQESAKSMDLTWVQKQNPEAYTIILASGDNPLSISQSLMAAPKTEHSAALKYEKHGQMYYAGVYGSFNDHIDAQNRLSTFPEKLKSAAKVVQWKNVQGLNYL